MKTQTKQPAARKGAYARRGRPASANKKIPNPSMLVYDVPEKLRLAFKSKCAMDNKPICVKIKELMEGYVAASK